MKKISSEIKFEAKGIKKTEQLVEEINHLASTANENNRNVILANKSIIESNYSLQTAIEQNIGESKKITKSIKNFENSTIESEKKMMKLASAQMYLALASVILIFKGEIVPIISNLLEWILSFFDIIVRWAKY